MNLRLTILRWVAPCCAPVLATWLLAASASAQIVDPELRAIAAAEKAEAERAEGDARLDELVAILERDRRETRVWRLSWLGIQSALIAGNLGWLAIDHDTAGVRAERALNAGASTIGLLAILFNSPPALRAPDVLSKLPEGTPEQRADKLRAAEELAAQSAEAQAFNTGWFPFVGGALVGAGVGVPLWFKYDRKLQGAGAFIGSIAVSAAQVITLPTHALDAQREAERRGRPTITVSLMPLGGLMMTGSW